MSMGVAITIFLGLVLVRMPVAAFNTSEYHIAMEGFAPYYTPNVATVLAGYPIKWNNRTATAHTVTHDGCRRGEFCVFDSGAVSPENSFILSSLQPGTYAYYCRLHPIMRGVITVTEPMANREEPQIPR